MSIQADRQILSAVVMNLLQNAFKFTRPRSTVTLSVTASAERVSSKSTTSAAVCRTETSTTCSAPSSSATSNGTGLGLGLAFSRWGAEVNQGRLDARNLPGRGCVFTLDLPRVPAPTLATETAQSSVTQVA